MPEIKVERTLATSRSSAVQSRHDSLREHGDLTPLMHSVMDQQVERRLMNMHMMRGVAFPVTALFCASCRPPQRGAVLRSPTLDYGAPAVSTSDGQTVGADKVAPGERLQQGARNGTQNQLAPGWKLERQGFTYDPAKRVGGATDTPSDDEGDDNHEH